MTDQPKFSARRVDPATPPPSPFKHGSPVTVWTIMWGVTFGIILAGVIGAVVSLAFVLLGVAIGA